MFGGATPGAGDSLLAGRPKRFTSQRYMDAIEMEKAGTRRSAMTDPSGGYDYSMSGPDLPQDASDLKLPARRRGPTLGGRMGRKVDLRELASLDPIPTVRQNFPLAPAPPTVVRDLAAAYAILRGFSFNVKLSPFTFEQLLNAVMSPHATVLNDEIHLSIMRTLAAGEPVRSRRMRILNPERLDNLSWPDFVFEWLEMQKSDLAKLKYAKYTPAAPTPRPAGPSAGVEAWLATCHGGSGRPESEGPLEDDPDHFIPPPPEPEPVKEEPAEEDVKAEDAEMKGEEDEGAGGMGGGLLFPTTDINPKLGMEPTPGPTVNTMDSVYKGPLPGDAAVKTWQAKRIAEGGLVNAPSEHVRTWLREAGSRARLRLKERKKTLRVDYYTLSPENRAAILCTLCDDLLESAAMKVELQNRVDKDQYYATRGGRGGAYPMLTRRERDLRTQALEAENDPDARPPHLPASLHNTSHCVLCYADESIEDGMLLSCDGCTASFHAKCIGLSSSDVPQGAWFCAECLVGGRGPTAGLRIAPSAISRDGHLHWAFEGRVFSTEKAVVLNPQGGGEVGDDEGERTAGDLSTGFVMKMNNEAAQALNRGLAYHLHREDQEGAKQQHRPKQGADMLDTFVPSGETALALVTGDEDEEGGAGDGAERTTRGRVASHRAMDTSLEEPLCHTNAPVTNPATEYMEFKQPEALKLYWDPNLYDNHYRHAWVHHAETIKVELETIEKASRKGRVGENYVPAGERPSLLELPEYRWPRDGRGFGPISGCYKKFKEGTLHPDARATGGAAEPDHPEDAAALRDRIFKSVPADFLLNRASSKLQCLAAVLLRMERELLGVLGYKWAGLDFKGQTVDPGQEEECLRKGVAFHEAWCNRVRAATSVNELARCLAELELALPLSLLPYNWLSLRVQPPRLLSEQELQEQAERRATQGNNMKGVKIEEPNEKAKKALKRALAGIRCGECTPCKNLSWKKPCERRLGIFMDRIKMTGILDRLQEEFRAENPGLTAREDILVDRFITCDVVNCSLGKINLFIKQARNAADRDEEDEEEEKKDGDDETNRDDSSAPTNANGTPAPDSNPLPISMRKEKRAAAQGKMYKESFLLQQSIERSKKENDAIPKNRNPDTADVDDLVYDEEEDVDPRVMFDYLINNTEIRTLVKNEKWIFKRPKETWTVRKKLGEEAGLRINRPDNIELSNMGFDFGFLRNLPAYLVRNMGKKGGICCPPGIDYRRGSVRVCPGFNWRARLDRCNSVSQLSLLLKELDSMLRYEDLKRPTFAVLNLPSLPPNFLSKNIPVANPFTHPYLVFGLVAENRRAVQKGPIEYFLVIDEVLTGERINPEEVEYVSKLAGKWVPSYVLPMWFVRLAEEKFRRQAAAKVASEDPKPGPVCPNEGCMVCGKADGDLPEQYELWHCCAVCHRTFHQHCAVVGSAGLNGSAMEWKCADCDDEIADRKRYIRLAIQDTIQELKRQKEMDPSLKKPRNAARRDALDTPGLQALIPGQRGAGKRTTKKRGGDDFVEDFEDEDEYGPGRSKRSRLGLEGEDEEEGKPAVPRRAGRPPRQLPPEPAADDPAVLAGQAEREEEKVQEFSRVPPGGGQQLCGCGKGRGKQRDVQCGTCGEWAHVECTLGGAAGGEAYTCDLCNPAVDKCSVCLQGHEGPMNTLGVMRECHNCHVKAHTWCFRPSQEEEEEDSPVWTCDPCKLNLNPCSLKCAICGQQGKLEVLKRIAQADWERLQGPTPVYAPNADKRMRPVDLRQAVTSPWVHSACAIFLPGCWTNPEGEIEGLTTIDSSNWKDFCPICYSNEGAMVKCAHVECGMTMHAYCARESGLAFNLAGRPGLDNPAIADLFMECFCKRHSARMGGVPRQRNPTGVVQQARKPVAPQAPLISVFTQDPALMELPDYARLQAAHHVLVQIMEHQLCAKWFNDPVPKEIPGYYKIVKRPMDLGTVRKNMEGGRYQNARQVWRDVQQVWQNCRDFNEPDAEVAIDAQSVERMITSMWEVQPLLADQMKPEPTPDEIAAAKAGTGRGRGRGRGIGGGGAVGAPGPSAAPGPAPGRGGGRGSRGGGAGRGNFKVGFSDSDFVYDDEAMAGGGMRYKKKRGKKATEDDDEDDEYTAEDMFGDEPAPARKPKAPGGRGGGRARKPKAGSDDDDDMLPGETEQGDYVTYKPPPSARQLQRAQAAAQAAAAAAPPPRPPPVRVTIPAPPASAIAAAPQVVYVQAAAPPAAQVAANQQITHYIIQALQQNPGLFSNEEMPAAYQMATSDPQTLWGIISQRLGQAQQVQAQVQPQVQVVQVDPQQAQIIYMQQQAQAQQQQAVYYPGMQPQHPPQ